jgi:hypothetical protein
MDTGVNLPLNRTNVAKNVKVHQDLVSTKDPITIYLYK